MDCKDNKTRGVKMATVVCSKCGHVHQVERELTIGKSVRCARCKETFVVAQPIDQPAIVDAPPTMPAVEVKRTKPGRSAWWDVLEDLGWIASYVLVMGGVLVVLGLLISAPNRDYSDDPLIRIENSIKGIHLVISLFGGAWAISNTYRWLKSLERKNKR